MVLVGVDNGDGNVAIAYALKAHGWQADEFRMSAVLETAPNAPTAGSSYYAYWRPVDDPRVGPSIFSIFPAATSDDYVVIIEPNPNSAHS